MILPNELRMVYGGSSFIHCQCLVKITWTTVSLLLLQITVNACPKLCAFIHYAYHLMSCFNHLPIRTQDLFCYQAQLSTVLHWVVCCVGWVHSFRVHFPWELPAGAKTSCWLEKSKFLAHLGTVHWKHIRLSSLLLKITWVMVFFSSLTFIKFSQLTRSKYAEGVVWHMHVDRGDSVLFSTKLMMM